MGFYFWGHVKQNFYSARIHNIQHLKQRMKEAAAFVTADVLGLLVRVPGYRSRDPGFDFRRYQVS
jgi:hypothetical protein